MTLHLFRDLAFGLRSWFYVLDCWCVAESLSFLATSPLTVCMCLISMVPRSISLLSLVVNAVYVWWGSRGPRATMYNCRDFACEFM